MYLILTNLLVLFYHCFVDIGGQGLVVVTVFIVVVSVVVVAVVVVVDILVGVSSFRLDKR